MRKSSQSGRTEKVAPGRESVTLEGKDGDRGRSILEAGVSSSQIPVGRRKKWGHSRVILEKSSLNSWLE